MEIEQNVSWKRVIWTIDGNDNEKLISKSQFETFVKTFLFVEVHFSPLNFTTSGLNPGIDFVFAPRRKDNEKMSRESKQTRTGSTDR